MPVAGPSWTNPQACAVHMKCVSLEHQSQRGVRNMVSHTSWTKICKCDYNCSQMLNLMQCELFSCNSFCDSNAHGWQVPSPACRNVGSWLLYKLCSGACDFLWVHILSNASECYWSKPCQTTVISLTKSFYICCLQICPMSHSWLQGHHCLFFQRPFFNWISWLQAFCQWKPLLLKCPWASTVWIGLPTPGVQCWNWPLASVGKYVSKIQQSKSTT